MRRFLAAVIVSLVLLPPQAFAAFVYDSVAELVRTCDDSMNTRDGAVEHGICIGYITGVGQTLNSLRIGNNISEHLRICLSPEDSVADRARVLVNYYRKLSQSADGRALLQKLESNPPEYIASVFAIAYPCK